MKRQTTQQTRYFGVAFHGVGAALALLLVGLSYSLVYRPLDQRREQSVGRMEQLDRLLSKQGNQGSEYRRLRTQLDRMKQSVAELHSQLSEEFSQETLLAEINELAGKSNIQILDYQVGAPERLMTHSMTEVEFSCHGSFASICKFLQEAEQITKVAKLSKLELISRDNSDGYPIQLTFVLYSEGKSNDTREKRGVL